MIENNGNWLNERTKAEEDRREKLRAVKRFHEFLQGNLPDGVKVRRFKKMNPDQAFSVVWFLQEVCHLIPENYEMCDNCNEIFDSYGEGSYDEKKGRYYCGCCCSGY